MVDYSYSNKQKYFRPQFEIAKMNTCVQFSHAGNKTVKKTKQNKTNKQNANYVILTSRAARPDLEPNIFRLILPLTDYPPPPSELRGGGLIDG